MPSIFQKKKYEPKQGRNGFDLSHRRLFTATTGMLLPVFKDFPNPGDHYKLNSDSFIRTEAVETAAFTRFKGHVDWFFVPMEQLYSLWNEFFNRTNDVNSSNFVVKDIHDELPRFDIYNLIANINSQSWFAYDTPGHEGSFSLYADYQRVPYLYNFIRLFDLMGYGVMDNSAFVRYAQTSHHSSNFYQYAFLDYLAYHKIFDSHYRIQDYTPKDNTLYNIDKYYKTSVIFDDSVIGPLLSTIHYRPWRKDYFTNIQPSPIFSGAFAESPFYGDTDSNQYFSSDLITGADIAHEGNYPNTRGDIRNYDPGNNNYYNTSQGVYFHNTSGSSGISVGQIREMFALDKLWRITGSTGASYADQIFAHFGYKVPKGINREVYYIGEQTTDINISEVVATSTSQGGSVLGEIAGKGFGVTNQAGDLEFTCPCHGVLMAIFSIEPMPDYAAKGVDKINRYTKTTDFYHPEFDNLGMQPIYMSEFNNSYSDQQNFNQFYGWQYRYSELKTKPDIVNAGIYDTSYRSWSIFKQTYDPDLTFSEMLDLNFNLYISPAIANPIFAMSFPQQVIDFDTAVNIEDFWTRVASSQEVFGYDNFKILTNFKVFKTSIMSVHSLPKIN